MTELERTEESAAEVLMEVAAEMRDDPDLRDATDLFTDELLTEVLGIAWRHQFDPDHRADAQRSVLECVSDAVDERMLGST